MKKRIKSIVTTLLVALLSAFVTFCSPITKQLADFKPHMDSIDVCSDPADEPPVPGKDISLDQ
jgi:hypothetical protein